MSFWDVSITDYSHLLIAHRLLEARCLASGRGGVRRLGLKREGQEQPLPCFSMVPSWTPLGDILEILMPGPHSRKIISECLPRPPHPHVLTPSPGIPLGGQG